MYTTERYEAIVSVDHYLDKYVDVDTFLQACKACPNYEKIWSCPTYDFDVIEYWKKYKTLELTAIKIIFDEAVAGKKLTKEEQEEITKNSIWEVKAQLAEELYEREKAVPGSISLSAGSCTLCKGSGTHSDGSSSFEGFCSRLKDEPCRYPDKMRYSIESLGGNVGTTLSELMEIELEWIQEGRMPSYFVLVSGLLRQ
ncbi:MAG: metal-binding protein [Firmicutes bacterium]|nr:metal-binding protein [Bacillota bacterium]